MHSLSVEQFKDGIQIALNLDPEPRSSSSTTLSTPEQDAHLKTRTHFYQTSLTVHTDVTSWIDMRVILSKWNQKPYLLMKIPPLLKEKLQDVNAIMMEKLKSYFPDAVIRPWVSKEHEWIRFSIPRQDLPDHRQGPSYVEIEEPGQGTTLIYGGSGIQDRLDGKELCALLEFEFHYVYKSGNVVGFTPRLLKLIDYTPTASLSGYNSL